MACEFLSGITQPNLGSSDVIISGTGNISARTIYLFLSARNRAGWTRPSNALAVNIPANSQLTIALNPSNRGLGTDFIRYSLSANTTNDPASAYQIGEWENYQADTYTRRTLAPLVFSENFQLDPPASIATPPTLPTNPIDGSHILIIGGLPNNAISSYYKYSSLLAATDRERVINGGLGRFWERVNSANTAQIIDVRGAGGCAAAINTIDPDYLIPPPPYDPIQPSPVKGIPIKLVWHNNTPTPLAAGTNFALEFSQGGIDRTNSFNGKAIVTFKGYTNNGDLDRNDGGTTMQWIDADRIWSPTIGDILILPKDLPPDEAIVWEIAPYFTSSQFGGSLAQGELIGISLYPLVNTGKPAYDLWLLSGDTILPNRDRLAVLPDLGLSVAIGSGAGIIKGYAFNNPNSQQVNGLVSDASNQTIAIDGNGICQLRTTLLPVEAALAIVSTERRTTELSSLTPSIAINGGANVTLTHPCTNTGLGTIRADYPDIGTKTAAFNPPSVRIYAKSGSNYYQASASGIIDIPVVATSTQTIAITSLAPIAAPTNPIDPLFGLFDPPAVAASAVATGTIVSGNYQFFASYYYNGNTVSKIERSLATQDLSFAELGTLNQGWGRPISNLADLRQIPAADTFAWQQRPLAGGSIFYYDPTSLATDDDVNTLKPAYLTSVQPGRWTIRKSFSVTPAGAWNNTTTYNYLDIVTDSGASYLYRNPISSAGNGLTDPSYWQQLADRGAQGIQGNAGTTGATTVGTNPNTPAINASVTYTIDSVAGLAIGQYYGFNGISGTLLATALPTATTVTLQNIDATVAIAIAANTKLVLTGKKGDKGDTGLPGTTGATTVGTNPNIPAINAFATYTIDTSTGLAIGQTYGFGSIAGTLEATALTATTVTLKNLTAPAAVPIAANTKLNLAGRKGEIGASGSPHIATGAYNSGSTYNRYDEVDYNGASYYWRNSTPGNTLPPANTSNTDWQLISARGQTGAVGTMGAIATGTNPNVPAIGASDLYTVDTTNNLAIGQYYGFNGIAGSLLVTAIPSATTVILQNADATAAAPVPTGTKLLAVGKTGQGIQGIPGAVGATTVGTNPNIPAINASANYTIDSVAGLAIGQYYGFNGVSGTLLLSAIASATTITLQNIDATTSAAISAGTRLVPVGKKGDAGSGGDMYRSTYDTDNNGIVDNAEALNGQPPSYYLDRVNHTGTQLATTISNFGEAVDDRVETLLVMGAGMAKVYDDTNNTLTLSSTATGGGISPWQLKTANYTAVAGDRLRVNATTGDVVITLPTGNATDPDIWIQRLDLTANKVLIRSGTQKINGQSGQDGVFAPVVPQVIERLSYVDATLGWLGQHDRLTYQAAPPSSGTNLTYVSDGDTNGLFYWLGTNLGTVAWANPAGTVRLSVLASTTEFGSVNMLSDRAPSNFYSNNAANQWIAWALESGRTISVARYTIRNRSFDTNHLPRNWVLEGTNSVTTFDIAGINAATWTAIDTKVNDATLTATNQYYTIVPNGSNAPYRYIRLRQSGTNSTGAGYFTVNELELYGVFS
jgi:hypothetical protein